MTLLVVSFFSPDFSTHQVSIATSMVDSRAALQMIGLLA
jgi:hypothetical protein